MKRKAGNALRCAIVLGLAGWMGLAMAQQAPAAHPWSDAKLSPDQRADLLLKQLTQDDKFQLIRSYFAGPRKREDKPAPPGYIGSAGYIPAIERLGIPAIQESDAGLGVASSERMRPGDY